METGGLYQAEDVDKGATAFDICVRLRKGAQHAEQYAARDC